jgi:hypothetical protein
MKFRNNSGGRLALPTLGIVNVEPGDEFEATGEAAKWLTENAADTIERTDKKSSGEPAGDSKEPSK